MQLVESFPNMYKALRSSPSHDKHWWGGAHLESQQVGGRGRRFRNSRPPQLHRAFGLLWDMFSLWGFVWGLLLSCTTTVCGYHEPEIWENESKATSHLFSASPYDRSMNIWYHSTSVEREATAPRSPLHTKDKTEKNFKSKFYVAVDTHGSRRYRVNYNL